MIELSSEARRAYEVMVSSLEQTGQEEEEEDIKELQINKLSLSEEPESVSDSTQPEEPEYSKSLVPHNISFWFQSSSEGGLWVLIPPFEIK